MAICTAFFVATGSFPALAQDGPPPIREFDVPTIEKLGVAIFSQDQDAWKATDLLLSKHSKADLEAEKVHGWIVDQNASGDVVRFVREGTAGPEAAYDIAFANGSPVDPVVPPDRKLSPVELAEFNARTLALKNIDNPCSPNYNTIVLKDPQSDNWLVWALAGTTDPYVVQVGGHVRFTISPDGTKVISKDALSRSCFVLKKPPVGDQEKVAALFYTQLVSNIPVETGVWLTLLHKLPFYVGMQHKSLWKIEGATVTRMK